jgi:hypothetical protein
LAYLGHQSIEVASELVIGAQKEILDLEPTVPNHCETPTHSDISDDIPQINLRPYMPKASPHRLSSAYRRKRSRSSGVFGQIGW